MELGWCLNRALGSRVIGSSYLGNEVLDSSHNVVVLDVGNSVRGKNRVLMGRWLLHGNVGTWCRWDSWEQLGDFPLFTLGQRCC